VRAFFKTLLLFALAGPLVGLLSLVPLAVLIAAWDAVSRVETFQFHPHFDAQSLQRLKLFVAGVYVIGFIPASFAGLLVAQARLLAGNALRLWHVLALGCLVGLIVCAMVGANHYLHDAHFFQGCALLVYVCAAATILCWLPARRWWPDSDLAG